MKKYKIIYADPPWSYRDKAMAGNRGAGCKYQTQDATWLNSLPVNDIAEKDCTLFLWVTMPKLNECFDLIKAWGFEYKTCAFTWVKRNKKATTWFWGMGRWTRANAELCLIATKGNPKRMCAGVHSVVDTAIEQHSKKPDEVKKRIVTLMGDIPRIELFARKRTEGWDSIGFDIDGMDLSESIKLLTQ
jgi:N6-adenosine-specific RNA methylase IME4